MLDENNTDRAYEKFHNHFQHLYNEAMPDENLKFDKHINAICNGFCFVQITVP